MFYKTAGKAACGCGQLAVPAGTAIGVNALSADRVSSDNSKAGSIFGQHCPTRAVLAAALMVMTCVRDAA
jgi:hypothetical protein